MSIKSVQWKTGILDLESMKEENTHLELIYENGESYRVPICEGNRHYDEIMKQVKEGTLTIKDAD